MVKVVVGKIPNRKFWNNKKVFITGHTSFKGTWLKIWLEHLGSKVYGLSKNYPSYPDNLYQKIYFLEEFFKVFFIKFLSTIERLIFI